MPQMVEIPSPSKGMPIPPKFELRPLTTLSRTDLQEATTMLAYAFDEHPLFRLAFPKAVSRSKILQTLFITVLKDAIRFGPVELRAAIKSSAFVATLSASCCGQSCRPHEAFPRPDDAQRVPPQGAALSRLLSGWKAARTCRHRSCQVSVERSHDKGWSIYLETQERRSANLYARLGFKMLQDGIETLPGGPLTWTMWRAPRVSTQPF